MSWHRIGRTFDPAARAPWMQTHAALPTVFSVDGYRARVFCAGRDGEGRGQIGEVILDMQRNELVSLSAQPILTYGELGAFDDRGVLPSCVVRTRGGWLLYYTGVMLGQTVPFYFAIGAATSVDGLTWTRLSRAPLLDRSDVDPYLTASPCVIEDSGIFRMWYVSGVRWATENGEPKHYYRICYAESDDAFTWRRSGHVCIDFEAGEYAIARPCVIRDEGGYRMWFPVRGASYRIHYAESGDGLHWTRSGEVMFSGADDAWDSQMQCYPWICDVEGQRFLLYNGNDYGKSGFGLAKEQ